MLTIKNFETRSGLVLEDAIIKLTQVYDKSEHSQEWLNQENNELKETFSNYYRYATFRVAIFASREKFDAGFEPVEEFKVPVGDDERDEGYLELSSEADAFEKIYEYLLTIPAFEKAEYVS